MNLQICCRLVIPLKSESFIVLSNNLQLLKFTRPTTFLQTKITQFHTNIFSENTHIWDTGQCSKIWNNKRAIIKSSLVKHCAQCLYSYL